MITSNTEINFKISYGDHAFSTYSKFSDKLVFLTSSYAHVQKITHFRKCVIRQSLFLVNL